MENIVPLELMSVGEVGRIVLLDGTPEVVHRLAEMGLREQCLVRMLQPGRPCLIVVGDHRLSLRYEEDVQILVALGPSCVH